MTPGRATLGTEAIDGVPSDYEVEGPYGTSFKYGAFDGAEERWVASTQAVGS